MSFVTGGGFDHGVGTESAHFETFDGILAESCLNGSVFVFEFLTLAVGEDGLGVAVFGVFAHGLDWIKIMLMI